MRFFSFGCSFTNYRWPTWADIIARERKNRYKKFENWGCQGASNFYIFNSVVECNLRNQITKDDTVMIMWSSLPRESHYVYGDKWLTPGNLFTQNAYPRSFVRLINHDRGFLIRDLSYIYATEQILKQIGCRYYFFSMCDIKKVYEIDAEGKVIDKNEDLFMAYKPILDQIRPSVFDTLLRYNISMDKKWKISIRYKLDQLRKDYNATAGTEWPSFTEFINDSFGNTSWEIKKEVNLYRKEWLKGNSLSMNKLDELAEDYHPLPIEHLQYLNTVAPEISIGYQTQAWTENITNSLLNKIDISNKWSESTVKRW